MTQKIEIFTGLNCITTIEKYKVSTSKNEEDYTFKYCYGKDDSDYKSKVTSYKGKNEKGEHTWFYEDIKLSTTLTLLKGGGLKAFTKMKDAKEGYDKYYGQLSTYTKDKEVIYLVVTGEKITILSEDPSEDIDIDYLKVKENFTSKYNSKKDFTVSAFKAFDIFEEKEITLSFKNKNQEIHWEEGGKKKVLKKK